LLLWLFRQRGWTLEGSAPKSKRCVIIGAPHTSNWDFVFFLGTTHHFGIAPSFMGKASLFRWPLKRFMLDMGGVPVDRSTSGNYVDAMIEAFGQRNALSLVVAPEATRGDIAGWRSGFYHIALGAGVPIVCAFVHHGAMRGGLGLELMPSGDFQSDLKQIADYYRSVMPDHPKLQVLYRQAGIA
jgi:1-acyl-sn-glycerol-3-phosphate acyltransferase